MVRDGNIVVLVSKREEGIQRGPSACATYLEGKFQETDLFYLHFIDWNLVIVHTSLYRKLRDAIFNLDTLIPS